MAGSRHARVLPFVGTVDADQMTIARLNPSGKDAARTSGWRSRGLQVRRVRSDHWRAAGRRIAIVVSGGNMDPVAASNLLLACREPLPV